MRSVRAVDGITRAGERRCTERQHVHAFAAIGKTGAVARDHLEPREQVMAEGDRLRDLQVREAGHDGGGLALGKVEQRGLQTLQIGVERIDLIAQIEAHVGRDLVVARAASMQLLAGDTDAVGEPRLNVHVHVLETHGPREIAARDLDAYGLQARRDGRALLVAQYADMGKHAGVGDRTGDVMHKETQVEIDRGGELLHETVGGLGKAAAPEFAGVVFTHRCLPSTISWIQRGGQYSKSKCATGRRRKERDKNETKSSYILAMLKWG